MSANRLEITTPADWALNTNNLLIHWLDKEEGKKGCKHPDSDLQFGIREGRVVYEAAIRPQQDRLSGCACYRTIFLGLSIVLATGLAHSHELVAAVHTASKDN